MSDPGSEVPGEARHAQRVSLAVVGIVWMTCANALTVVDPRRSRLDVLPHSCHRCSQTRDAESCRAPGASGSEQALDRDAFSLEGVVETKLVLPSTGEVVNHDRI